ncbi:DNA repair protein RecO [Paenalcaligenes niemegkensis]|uniref:DNA repair protein RecO n=1 Tax=Paenalcaligenes niemegkensis TaxID=2895469 RepID=UPI001EE7C6E2|nr:DNA repair protein RecO [Paenalcaligenes niemegkensis]MCQ9616877.1 DNA repair protein RecO [Paenalcaligenes niemegkensis]
MSRRRQRVHNERAYVLHFSPWRETSLVIQVFSKDYGCLPLVAKGAKRPHSALKPVLSVFQPLALGWTGMNEVKTLTQAECAGIHPLAGRAMMSGWYMNELLLRLLPREDPHPLLFEAYELTLQQLVDDPRSAPMALRRFEWILLQQIGYGLDHETPDFSDPDLEPYLRTLLRERLDHHLGRPLRTRDVLMDLQQF